MNLRTVLTPETVELHLKGTTKEQIIDEMLEILIKAGKVTDKAAALECVLDRERKMSTGMKHGIAIPHGKTDAVNDVRGAIGISRRGIDYDALFRAKRLFKSHGTVDLGDDSRIFRTSRLKQLGYARQTARDVF